MATVPAIYVSIQDTSFALPTIDSQRSGLVVVLSDRGPHNRVVEVNSVQEFVNLFGKPDFERTGPGHYMAYKFLQYSSKLYVIRPSLTDSTKKTNGISNNATIANNYIGFYDGTGYFEKINGNFVFTNVDDFKFNPTETFTVQTEAHPGGPGYSGDTTVLEVADTADLTDIKTIEDDGAENASTITLTEDDAADYNVENGNIVPISAKVYSIDTSSSPYKIYLEELYTDVSSQSFSDGDTVEVFHNLDNPLAGDIVTTDAAGFNKIKIGDNILNYNDKDIPYPGSQPANAPFRNNVAEEVISKDINPISGQYEITLQNKYLGTSTVDNDPANDPDYSSIGKWYSSLEAVFNPSGNKSEFEFYDDTTDTRNKVKVPLLEDYNKINIGDWIVPESEDVSHARQVVAMEAIDVDPDPEITTLEYYLTLDSNYTGSMGGTDESPNPTAISRYVPVVIDSNYNITQYPLQSGNDLLETNPKNDLGVNRLFNIYANGTGSFYDNIFIRADRNIELESMQTDANGNPLYKYAFADVRIYKEKEDGNSVLLEGPWTTSLIRKDKEGNVIKNVFTGEELYFETVINRYSDYVAVYDEPETDDILLKSDNAEKNRLQVLSLLTNTSVVNSNVVNSSKYYRNTQNKIGAYLDNGSDGVQYDKNMKLRLNNMEIEGILTKAYNGTLNSVDGTIGLILQEIYPWFLFDYVISGGYTPNVQNAARQLVDTRMDGMLIADSGFSTSADEDLNNRRNFYDWNTYNAMLYTQYRRVFDENNGRYIVISPAYQAIENHLSVDRQYWIAEPVAGIEKGAIATPIKLQYTPDLTKMSELIEYELNPTIVEPDGTYFLTQFTTWKRLSIMKRAHAVKFLHYVKKTLPSILKDILQRKASNFWIGMAQKRTNGFLEQFVEGKASAKFAAIKSYSANVSYDEARSELTVSINLKLIGAIEVITVNIAVS